MNGPAPTGFDPKSLPSALMAVGEPTKANRLVKFTANSGDAAFRVNTTVDGSGAVMDAICPAAAAPKAALFSGSCSRWVLKITASASRGVPSVNLTPGRSFIVHTVESVVVRDWASWGTTVLDASSQRIKLSNIENAGEPSAEANPPKTVGSRPRPSSNRIIVTLPPRGPEVAAP